MSIVDETCLNYLNTNSSIVKKIKETKFDRTSIDKMLIKSASEEFKQLTEELKTVVRATIKLHGVSKYDALLYNFDVEGYSAENNPIFIPFEKAKSITRKIGNLLYNNKLISIADNQPYIYVSGSKIELSYGEDSGIELKSGFTGPRHSKVITSFSISEI